MLNGLQVLESIDDSLARARRDADLIDQEIAALSNRLLVLRDEAAAAYRTLARLRLTGGGRDALIEQLTEADQRLKALLAERATELARLDEEIEGLRVERHRLSQPRDAASGELDRRERSLAAAEATARAALGETDAYREAHAALQMAEQTARFAAQKSALAARDRQQKGAAYESDPLFMYLWRRRYGTADYRANALSRYFDSRVARVCDFARARPNYAMLLEIPLRLAAHAELRQAAVEEQKDSLRGLERTALSTPELSALRAERDRAQRAHDELDARVSALDARIDELGEDRGRFNRGDDELSRRASAAIESALRRADLQTLREAAIGTPLEEDDAAVQQLEAIDVERARIQSALETQKRIQRVQRERLAELEHVRHDYRRGPYRADQYDFRNGDLLGVLLGEVLRGAISRDVFWDSMRQHRRAGVGDNTFGWPGGSGSGSEDAGFGDSDFRTGGSF